MSRAWLVVTAVLFAGCLPGSKHRCNTATDCQRDDEAGICASFMEGSNTVGYCAFGDELCPSGYRFEGNAGPAADQCTADDGPEVDGGLDADAGADAGTDATPTSGRDTCVEGPAIAADQDACTAAVCAIMPTCCDSSWGRLCVQLAETQDVAVCAGSCSGLVAMAGQGVVQIAAVDGTGMHLAHALETPGSLNHGVAWADLGFPTPSLAVVALPITQSFPTPHNQVLRWDGEQLQSQLDLDVVLPALAGREAREVSIGDRDHDGDLDLAIAGQGRVDVVTNNGSGSFAIVNVPTPPDFEPTGSWVLTSAEWGNLDADPEEELAIVDYNRRIAVLDRRGGAWTWVWQADLSALIEPPWDADPENDEALSEDASWGDLDGDGDLDLAVGGFNFAVVYRNDAGVLSATPAWARSPLAPEPRTSRHVYDLEWIDVNRDGTLELLVVHREAAPEIFLRTEAGDTLATTSAWQGGPEPGAYFTKRVAVGDVDGDRDLDFVSVGTGGKHRLYRNFTARGSRNIEIDESQVLETGSVEFFGVDLGPLPLGQR